MGDKVPTTFLGLHLSDVTEMDIKQVGEAALPMRENATASQRKYLGGLIEPGHTGRDQELG